MGSPAPIRCGTVPVPSSEPGHALFPEESYNFRLPAWHRIWAKPRPSLKPFSPRSSRSPAPSRWRPAGGARGRARPCPPEAAGGPGQAARGAGRARGAGGGRGCGCGWRQGREGPRGALRRGRGGVGAAEAQGDSASGVWCLPEGSRALASVRSGLALPAEVSSGEGGWGEQC